jgi:hypothetical protein
MSPTLEPERVSTIDDALELEWYAGDTIIAYVLYSMSPQILQKWSAVALDVLRDWPVGKPYLALYDLSARGVVINYLDLVKTRMFSLGITEAGEKRVLADVASRENFGARVVLHASLTQSGFIGRLFAQVDAQRIRFDNFVEYNVFYEREAALNWLTQTGSKPDG